MSVRSPYAAAAGPTVNAATRTPGGHPSAMRASWDRLTIQMMAAITIATVVGVAVSDTRWYWAVLTAFVVVLGVQSRGEIVTRGLQRIGGTVAGVVVGAAVAFATGDDTAVKYVLIVVFVWLAFYLAGVSYLWLSFFITVMVVILLDLVGHEELRVLGTRITETAAGVVVGVGVVYLVMSRPASPELRHRLAAYFDSLTALVTRSAGELRHPSSGDDNCGRAQILADARALDAAQAVILGDAAANVAALSPLHRAMLREMRPRVHLATLLGRSMAWAATEPLLTAARSAAARDPRLRRLDTAVDGLGDMVTRVLDRIDGDNSGSTTATPEPAVVTMVTGDPVRDAETLVSQTRSMGDAITLIRARHRERRVRRQPRSTSSR